ncbi:MAG: hypothetical protein KAH97_08755 [Anaerolineales bacterium]|nr:hypothetical protein [Anaerolineales bacterium]
MRKMKNSSGLCVLQIDKTFAAEKEAAHREQLTIMIRLRAATSSSFSPEVSNAWNERRIIRKRIQDYASVH